MTTLAGVSVGQHWLEWRGGCFSSVNSSVTLCSPEALLVSDTRYTGNLCNHGNIRVCSTPLTMSPTLWKYRNPQWGEVSVITQSHPYILSCCLWGPHDVGSLRLEVKVFFIITMFTDFSLCCYLHLLCRNNGGKTAGVLAPVKPVTARNSNNHCIFQGHTLQVK